MLHIRQILNDELKNHGYTKGDNIIVSDDNAQKLICRIKISQGQGSIDPVVYLRDLDAQLLSSVQIKGISGITQCMVNSCKKDIILPSGQIISPYDSNYEEVSKLYDGLKYYLETNGSNFKDVLSLENIDTFNTVTNNVWEIYELYGIEAARTCIITEFNQLFEYNETYIQERHLSLLVDSMTNQGTLVSVDRHGMNRTESGPLHRASFEETTLQLANAALGSETDLMTGVSANIMFGQFIPTGTNSFKIGVDLEKLKKQVPPKMPKLITHEIQQPVITEDSCSDDKFEFNFKLE